MAYPMREADLGQLLQLRVHDDEVDAKRPVGERRGRGDLLGQALGAHGAAGQDAESGRIADRGHQPSLGHPGHGAAEHGKVTVEEPPTTFPQRANQRVRRQRRHRHQSRSRPQAVCSARSASSVYSSPISTLILISDVEIA